MSNFHTYYPFNFILTNNELFVFKIVDNHTNITIIIRRYLISIDI